MFLLAIILILSGPMPSPGRLGILRGRATTVARSGGRGGGEKTSRIISATTSRFSTIKRIACACLVERLSDPAFDVYTFQRRPYLQGPLNDEQ